MKQTHHTDKPCPIIEHHKSKETAKVWFSGTVAQVFNTYDQRSLLVAALGDEINQIRADYIPYILLDFQQMTFVCATLWSEQEQMFLMEIDLAVEAREVCKISSQYINDGVLNDEDIETTTVH